MHCRQILDENEATERGCDTDLLLCNLLDGLLRDQSVHRSFECVIATITIRKIVSDSLRRTGRSDFIWRDDDSSKLSNYCNVR